MGRATEISTTVLPVRLQVPTTICITEVCVHKSIQNFHLGYPVVCIYYRVVSTN